MQHGLLAPTTDEFGDILKVVVRILSPLDRPDSTKAILSPAGYDVEVQVEDGLFRCLPCQRGWGRPRIGNWRPGKNPSVTRRSRAQGEKRNPILIFAPYPGGPILP